MLDRPPKPPKPPAPSTRRAQLRRERHRRHRLRQRLGVAIARAPYDADVVNLLVLVTRMLDPDRAGDATAIGEAMFRVLKESAMAAKAEGAIP